MIKIMCDKTFLLDSSHCNDVAKDVTSKSHFVRSHGELPTLPECNQEGSTCYCLLSLSAPRNANSIYLLSLLDTTPSSFTLTTAFQPSPPSPTHQPLPHPSLSTSQASPPVASPPLPETLSTVSAGHIHLQELLLAL